ncbi:NOI protein, nitrate-induced [Musa troglodytarum]|nr:NOI protein, nitrate-induced [Musa troglodytarum]
MSTILPQLRGSLLYSTKLEMKRRQVPTPGQQQHRQEMMQVVSSNKMIPISIQEKVGSGFAAVECLLFGANRQKKRADGWKMEYILFNFAV